jgi:hypothetical protein
MYLTDSKKRRIAILIAEISGLDAAHEDTTDRMHDDIQETIEKKIAKIWKIAGKREDFEGYMRAQALHEDLLYQVFPCGIPDSLHIYLLGNGDWC